MKSILSSLTNLALDAQARERALEPRSFIVQAPAGSGKTELLTQRFLSLLAHVDEPEQVVALTFTNKAASEMRHRILSSLQSAAAGVQPSESEPHKQITYQFCRQVITQNGLRGWKLLSSPDRLRIMTIDSLCGMLVRQMPLSSGFGGQPRIEPNPEPYYRNAAQDTLALAEGNHDSAFLVQSALGYFRNDTGKLTALLVAMLAQRDQWHRDDAGAHKDARERTRTALATLIAPTLQKVAVCFPPAVQQDIIPAAAYAATHWGEIADLVHWTAPLVGVPSEIETWRALARLLLTDKNTLRTKFDARAGLPADEQATAPLLRQLQAALKTLGPDAAACLACVRVLPNPQIADSEWDLIKTMLGMLPLAEERLQLAFQNAGVTDFIEVTQSAIRALGSQADPAAREMHLDYPIHHLLIDEFQDTSPKQVELVTALTQGWATNPKRTLFVVGDPMQSIYRFRKADVGLFLTVAAKGIGGIKLEPVQLYRNNRCDPAVVTWLNAVFSKVFAAQNDPASGAVRYAHCEASRHPVDSAAVTCHPIVRTIPVDAGRQQEAQKIIAIIQEARKNDPHAQIAVLVRARSNLETLTTALRNGAARFPYQAVEIEALSKRQVVQDLVSLTQALLHRGDRVHWLAILRAPWCGVTLADLHRLAADDHRSTVWQLINDADHMQRLSVDGRQRIEHVRQVLTEAFDHQGRQSLRRWIEQVWRLLGGALVLASQDAHQDAAAYFDLLDNLPASGVLDVEDILARIEDLFAQPNSEPEAQHVQLMTIHNAKGLEFDCVIVPGLCRTPPPPDKVLLRWERVEDAVNGECMIPAAIPSPALASAESLLYDFLSEREKLRASFEIERLLYVAATRAKRHLHLLGRVSTEEQWVPEADTMLSLLWRSEQVRSQFAIADEEPHRPGDVVADAARDAYVAPLVRLPIDALAGHHARHGQWTPAVSAASSPVEPATYGKLLDPAVGTLVHRCLQIVAHDGLDAWSTERCERLVPAYEAWLRSKGFSRRDAEQGAATVRAAMVRCLSSNTGRWLLGPRDQARAEWALTSLVDDNSAVSNHVVDRTFTENGCRWIIDYKTVRYQRDGADTFLRQHAQANYRPQLARYAGLFLHEGLNIRAAIYYVLQDVLIELDVLSDESGNTEPLAVENQVNGHWPAGKTILLKPISNHSASPDGPYADQPDLPV